MPEENNDLPSLEALSAKIQKLKPKPEADAPGDAASDYSLAFRFITDLMSGVIVGGLIGYGIDYWMDTLPWAMLVCIFLGTAAGIRNMMQSAKRMENKERE